MSQADSTSQWASHTVDTVDSIGIKNAEFNLIHIKLTTLVKADVACFLQKMAMWYEAWSSKREERNHPKRP